MAPIQAHHSPVSMDIEKLTPEELRYQICMFLGKRSNNGKLAKSALADAAESFGRKKGIVRQLWRTHKNAIVNPDKFKLDV